MSEAPRHDPRPRSSGEVFEGSNAIVELLSQHGITVAPHVAARLGLGLAGDAGAIIEVATALRASQRLGLTSLPDPLPTVPAVDVAIGPDCERLVSWERQALVIAAVCIDDRIDVLLAATGRSMAELVESALSRHLLLVAGHFAFADPRTRVWVHGHASLADRTAAHGALADAYRIMRIPEHETWHRSLATLEGSSDLVGPLLDIAERADAAGEAEWAHTVAREAASHAGGEQAVRARSIAGRAALHAGFVEEAERWFGDVLRRGDEPCRTAVLGEYLIAVAMLSGDVPDLELDERLEHVESCTEGGRHALARALLIAAGLLAERGAMHRAVQRLAQARELLDRSGLPRDEWRAMRDWCALFGSAGCDSELATGGPTLESGPIPETTYFGAVRVLALALERGLAGDAVGAARRLAVHRDVVGATEGVAAAVERSPLMRAERAVAIALLELWAGEVGRAANGLRQAASDLPIALAFGGLGAALARRIELVSTGEIGPWARAIESVLPQPVLGVRREDLIDRAVSAHLHGRRAEAETLVALADERSLREFGCGLHVPGLDAASEDLGGSGDAPVHGVGRTEPAHGAGRRTPDARLASELRHRMRCIDRAGFDADHAAVAELARAIVSPYERARTELMLARTCAAFGASDLAERHLVAAEHLFGDCGAIGWLQAVAAERESHGGGIPAGAPAAGSLEPPGIGSEATEQWDAGARGVGRIPPPIEAGNAEGAPRAASAPYRREAASAPADEASRQTWDLADCRAAWAQVLTDRELEVAMLVVEGISNRDAAARLFVSVRTVEVHVGRVFSKLAVHSRVELAVLAHRMHGRMSGTHT
ncbi:LuxR family transcriptional regulator [Agromyces fucosus]|uniref:LuxR family transcriptional regulator n=1 Tax=Agromyces fucosus TaxID=41985 RepID=A0A4Q2JME0_9MICO|nr:helix-turn-helix transcriptional regulator [Agromyces fucosus]RXZ47906.1 LuxR family transcriptional regulator [Agromyces fucosus]